MCTEWITLVGVMGILHACWCPHIPTPEVPKCQLSLSNPAVTWMVLPLCCQKQMELKAFWCMCLVNPTNLLCPPKQNPMSTHLDAAAGSQTLRTHNSNKETFIKLCSKCRFTIPHWEHFTTASTSTSQVKFLFFVYWQQSNIFIWMHHVQLCQEPKKFIDLFPWLSVYTVHPP